jgi:hypothetical protein
LWSKFASLPPHLRRFQIAISESGPHHSWTADHLLSFPKLQLDALSHLSVIRIVPPLHFSPSSNILEYDARIDDVATLTAIPKDVVVIIRGAEALTVLECDWWSWKPEDVRSLLERCTQLEVLILLCLILPTQAFFFGSFSSSPFLYPKSMPWDSFHALLLQC